MLPKLVIYQIKIQEIKNIFLKIKTSINYSESSELACLKKLVVQKRPGELKKIFGGENTVCADNGAAGV